MRIISIIIFFLLSHVIYGQEENKRIIIKLDNDGIKRKADSCIMFTMLTIRDTIEVRLNNGYIEIPFLADDCVDMIVRYRNFTRKISNLSYQSDFLNDRILSWTFGLMKPPYEDEFIEHFSFYSHLPKILYWIVEDDEFSSFSYYPFYEDLYIIEEEQEE